MSAETSQNIAVDRPRLDFVDGFRAIAALFVVLAHSYYQPQNGFYATRWMTHLGLTHGRLAVVIFIVISGFCLGLPTAMKGDVIANVQEFFKRRALRILPPFYACLVISILFILIWAHRTTGTVWDNSLPLSNSTVLNHLFLTHDLPVAWQAKIAGLLGMGTVKLSESHGDINYPLWSIAVEWQLYLFFPLIVWSFRRLGTYVTVGWTVVAGLLAHILPQGFLDSATPWYLGQLTMGAASARFVVQTKTESVKKLRTPAVLLGLSLLTILLLKGKSFHDRYEPYVDTAVACFTALMLAVSYSDATELKYLFTRILSHPLHVRLGVFSYSLYLIHAPILHAADQFCARFIFATPELRFGFLLLFTPITIFGAYCFYMVFERPCIAILKRRKR